MRKLFVLCTMSLAALLLPSKDAHALFYKNTTTLWGTPQSGATIPVCYTATLAQQPNFANFLAVTRNAIGQSWERAANITFTGWQQCPSPPFPPATLVLEYLRCAFSAGIGKSTQFASVISLDFNNNDLDHSCGSGDNSNAQRWAYMVGQEFGHVLGFEHEQDRWDNPFFSQSPGGCPIGAPNAPILPGVVTAPTPFDLGSVMGYCTTPFNAGRFDGSLGGWIPPFTSWDMIGALLTYGKKPDNSIIGLNGLALTAASPSGAYIIRQANSSVLQSWYRSGNKFFDPFYHFFSPAISLSNDIVNANFGSGADFNVGGQWIMMGDKCVGASSADAQTWLTIQTCGTRPYESWTWDRSTSRLLLKGTNMCVNIPFGSATVGNHVQIYPCSDPVASNEQFQFNPYDIQYGGLCFNVVGGLPNDGSWIQLYPCSSSHDANDMYHFRGMIGAGGTRCMESVPGGTSVHVAGCFQRVEQTWDVWP